MLLLKRAAPFLTLMLLIGSALLISTPAVAQMDLGPGYAACSAEGRGKDGQTLQMMTGVFHFEHSHNSMEGLQLHYRGWSLWYFDNSPDTQCEFFSQLDEAQSWLDKHTGFKRVDYLPLPEYGLGVVEASYTDLKPREGDSGALSAKAAGDSGSDETYLCMAGDPDYNGGGAWSYAIFKTNQQPDDVAKQWAEYARSSVSYSTQTSCKHFSDPQEPQAIIDTGIRRTAGDGTVYTRISWEPVASSKPQVARNPKVRKATVFFRSAKATGTSGYENISFQLDYTFLACAGELHIAYSVDPESVFVGDPKRESARATKAIYTYNLRGYSVEAPPSHIESVKLKGDVFYSGQEYKIGSFGDDFAAKAMGFGCFSGQTKKIADIKDLARFVGEHPDEQQLAKFFDKLTVIFKSDEVYTSSAAESEIRAGQAKEEADKQAAEQKANDAADERAARRAAEEAEFQAKQKAYEEGMAAHKAAVEQYEKALADMEAQKATNAAEAKAQQEEFARKQAEYEAEVARAKQAQAEYEAKYGKPQ